MGINVQSPIIWTGSVYLGRKSTVNTQIQFNGRLRCQSSAQSGGLVLHGTSVDSVTQRKGSHVFEDSTINTVQMTSGSSGFIRASSISLLTVEENCLSSVCSLNAGSVSLSQSIFNFKYSTLGSLTAHSSRTMFRSCDVGSDSFSSTDVDMSSVNGSSIGLSSSYLRIFKGRTSAVSGSGSHLFATASALASVGMGSSSTSDIRGCSMSSCSNGSGSSMYVSSCSVSGIGNAGDLLEMNASARMIVLDCSTVIHQAPQTSLAGNLYVGQNTVIDGSLVVGGCCWCKC